MEMARTYVLPPSIDHAVYVTGAIKHGIRRPDKLARAFVNKQFPEDGTQPKHIMLVWGGQDFGTDEKPTASDLTYEVYKLLTARGLHVSVLAVGPQISQSVINDERRMYPKVVQIPYHEGLYGKTHAGLDPVYDEYPVGTTQFFYYEVASHLQHHQIHVFLAPGEYVSSEESLLFSRKRWISLYPYDFDDPENGLVEPLGDVEFARSVSAITNQYDLWSDRNVEIVRKHGGTMLMLSLRSKSQ